VTGTDFPDDATIQNMIDQLTPLERENGVAYLLGSILTTGIRLSFPSVTIEVPWTRAGLAFVDRDPMANWSHSSRYILIDLDSENIRSYEAKLPPFQPGQEHNWRYLYKAPSVPEAALMVKPG
jgi:hypothetical protein